MPDLDFDPDDMLSTSHTWGHAATWMAATGTTDARMADGTIWGVDLDDDR